MRYHDLGLSLTEEQKVFFKNIMDTRQSHPNIGRHGKNMWLDVAGFEEEEEQYINDEIVSKLKIKPWRLTLMGTPPNKFVVPHKDPPDSRLAAVIFPVYPEPPNYRPAFYHFSEKYHDWDKDMQMIPYMTSYLFDTQTRHSVTNNEYYRFSFQLWYRETYDELYEAHQKGDFLL